MERKATIHDMSRVCRTYPHCEGCPLKEMEDEYGLNCTGLIMKHPDKVSDIVLKWCDEHPEKRKTYRQDFLEKFPNTRVFDSHPPEGCREAIYGCSVNCKAITCHECWNEVMPE